jgi:DNA-binding GntR family transcriptional regulator
VGERESRDAYQVRAVLEKLAVQLGAARLRERLRELRTEADATLSAAKCGNVTRFLHHNIRFHQMIVEAADNAVLQRTWAALVFTVGARAVRTASDLTAVAREHREIVEAIARGDTKAAGRILRRHGEALFQVAAEVEPRTLRRSRGRASEPATRVAAVATDRR